MEDFMPKWLLKVLSTPAEMAQVEQVQRQVWAGNDTEIVPASMLMAAIHNGGSVIGAFVPGSFSQHVGIDFAGDENLSGLPAGQTAELLGFVFDFPGFISTPDGLQVKLCSHMLGVLPEFQGRGVGFALKRAQWQLARHAGIHLITWTYDPLLSRNAYLNITRLGAVCHTYLRNEYGELRDELNSGMPTDRFQVNWWLNTPRVERRLSRQRRRPLDLAHFLEAETEILNPTTLDGNGLPRPASETKPIQDKLGLVEIPSDLNQLRRLEPALALEWREHTREIFERLFHYGYLVTDFIYLQGTAPRSFYVLIDGESTLQGEEAG